MFSPDTIRCTFGSEEGGDSVYLIHPLYVLTPQGGKQTRLQLVKEIRHFEALGLSSDEEKVRSPIKPQGKISELFDFAGDFIPRDDK
jgi:hypothetical protein